LGAALERIQRLDHPGIARMYEFGWADELLFYVLARDTGPTLRECLERERQLPVGEAVAIADSLAAALAHAHEHGVLHGDLRSKHVQLVAPGRGVVKSFGIMNALVGGAGGSSTVVRFGSPAYLSPEQLAGERSVTERTDQYSLGCVLYEMLTGEVPFASASQMKLVTAKLTQDAPYVRAVRPTVSEALDGVIRRCLGRLPADRFRSVAELRDALSRVPVV
jgi:serine/threonine-protein kinase